MTIGVPKQKIRLQFVDNQKITIFNIKKQQKKSTEYRAFFLLYI